MRTYSEIDADVRSAYDAIHATKDLQAYFDAVKRYGELVSELSAASFIDRVLWTNEPAAT